LVGTSIFPDVFVGPEPRPIKITNPPTEGEVAQALESAGKSTVRIEGLGCGGLKTGSGFIASPGLVVTNAHVVAGLNNPIAVDVNGKNPAKLILFNPDLDIAILRVNGLTGKPLNVSSEIYERGTSAAVLGYPGGQSLEVDAALLLQNIKAKGRDIYNKNTTIRDIYSLQTNIAQGNSGGPVVLPDGTVIGVIFARSLTHDNTGYALTSKEVLPYINKAKNLSKPVMSGECTR
jgi:S1-C subfamily serine protease